MRRPPRRIPLPVQLAAVGLLLAGSVLALGVTVASVVRREGRRLSAERDLAIAGDRLGARGVAALAEVPNWPGTLGPAQWAEIGRRLRAASTATLADFRGVEGGYFALEGRRFLGSAFPTRRPGPAARHDGGPPPLEYDLVETQVDASIRKAQPTFLVANVPPSLVALRTAPVALEGRRLGATWTMTRLVNPIDQDRARRGYALAAGLATLGIGSAVVLTSGLVRSLSRLGAERARLQAELRRGERLAALGKLVAGVAHEVRNPLAGIRAIAQLWRRGLGRDDEALGHLTDEVDRLETIVSRLLQFSRAEAPERAPADLDAVVAEAARLAASTAEPNVTFTLDLDGHLPAVPMAPASIVQVLRNLTANAAQAMPGGGVVRLSTRREPGGWGVSVVVADTGPGLAPGVVEHLFEPFFTTRPEGTGLGLAIAREIALAHRGDLTAANLPGGGAAFTLTLPVADPGDR